MDNIDYVMLLESIEFKRSQMIIIANKTGLSSCETLECSQELDKLLTLYQNQLKSSIVR